MYTTANVRKFLNASNSLMLESNENVINKFTEMILEKFEDIENYSKYENLRSFFKTNSNCNNKEDNIINYNDRYRRKKYSLVTLKLCHR